MFVHKTNVSKFQKVENLTKHDLLLQWNLESSNK